MSMYVLKLVGDYSFNDKRVDLLTKANILANFAAESSFEENSNVIPLKRSIEIVGDARVIYLDGDTKVLFDTSETADLVGKSMPVGLVTKALEGVESVERTEENGKTYINVAVPVIKNSKNVGVIYVQSPADDMVVYLNHIRHNLLMISIAVIAIVIFLSLTFSNILTAPLSNITARISEMSANDARQPIEVRGTNEVNELVSAFNTMVGQIDLVEEKRQEFVSNASHELKTPLSSIKLICDSILQNPDTSPEMVNEFLNDMNDEVDRLTRITNKLLNLTKMDAAAEENEMIDFSVINLKNLIKRIVKALKPLARQKHIKIETHLLEDVFARVDADKMWEAIYNIVDNSIKYTPQGGWVYVELYRDKREAVITVGDNGIGMEAEETEKIFDRFYRVDKARARETGGTGLGLSIVRSAVELHKGKIEVESREEVGSLFRITIPTVVQ